MSNKRLLTQKDVPSLTEGEQYENLIIEYLNLKSKVFTGCSFTNCSFKGSDLTDAKMNSCNFKSCDFTEAKIAGINLFDSHFTECKLIGIDFQDIDKMTVSTFHKCILDYSVFRGIDLGGLDFSGSSLKEVDFSISNLEKTNLTNCELINPIFHETKFWETDLRGSTIVGVDIRKDDLKGIVATPTQAKGLIEEVGIKVFDL